MGVPSGLKLLERSLVVQAPDGSVTISVLSYPLPFTGPLVPEEVVVKQGGPVPASS